MRCLRLLLLMGVVAALASPAWAITITMHVKNFDEGTLYNVVDNTYTGVLNLDALAQLSPVGGLTWRGQSDTWGIFRVDDIQDTDGNYLYQGSASREITAIFWGETDNYLKQTTTTGLVAQEIHGIGLQAAFFYDTTPDWATVAKTTGPAGWTPDYGADGQPGKAGVDDDGDGTADNSDLEYLWAGSDDGGPQYTGITDGNLIWTMNSTSGKYQTFPTDEFFADFDQAQAAYASSGAVLLDMGSVDGWGTGPDNWQLDTQTIPAWNTTGTALDKMVDLQLEFDGTSQDSGAWLLRTSDPMEGDLVPEPVTMAGLLLGIGCLGRYVRRRR